MKLRGIELLTIQSLMFSLCVSATAQFSITRPKPASIQQVSATSEKETPAEGIVTARVDTASQPQMRVTIQYLMVDAATRDSIYETIGADAIVNTTNVPSLSDPATEDEDPLVLSAALTVESSHRFHSPSRVTTCILDDSEKASIIEKAAESASCTVSSARSLILLDGKTAEMNDMVQHPFVVDVQAVGEHVNPTVRVFQDGIRIRLLASLSDSADAAQEPTDSITLSCEINTSRILELKTHQVYGVQDKPVTVQVPIHQVTASQASRKLAKGQTLMIDPHYSRTKTVQSEVGVPLLGKLPYVGRSFKNISVGDVEQHMIVLLQTSIEKE